MHVIAFRCLTLFPSVSIALTACQPATRPTAAGVEDDRSGAADAGDAGAPSNTANDTEPPLEGPRDAGGAVIDGGATVTDASDGVVIGVIDPDEVSVVEVEAGRPPRAVCPELTRDVEAAATLPEDAIPLSVTPDGATWAYAVVVSPSSDASAGITDVDAGTSSAAATLFQIHVTDGVGNATLALPDDQDPTRGAALDPTGHQLVTTLSDTRGFVSWELDEAGDAFRLAEPQPFVRLNALAQNGGVRFEKPVFSTSGIRMYARELGARPAVVQLVLRDSQWETELRITNQALGLEVFSVTAASSDDLTLFGQSSTDEPAVAWWRPRPDEPFHASLNIGPTPPLAVSTNCKQWWTLQ